MKLITATVALVAALVLTSSAAAAVFTIRGDWRMGSFAVKKDGTLRGAVDAFGQPTKKIRNGESCAVRWTQHGLRIFFYNLGGNNPCRGKFGFFSNARAKGSTCCRRGTPCLTAAAMVLSSTSVRFMMWKTSYPLASSHRRRRSSKRKVLKFPMWA